MLFTRNYAKDAEEHYQISEVNGEIWITYDGVPIIPESMLKLSAVDALKELRTKYVERHEIKC